MFQQRCTTPIIGDDGDAVSFYNLGNAEQACTEDPDCIGVVIWGGLGWEDPDALYLCGKRYLRYSKEKYEYFRTGIVFNKKGI